MWEQFAEAVFIINLFSTLLMTGAIWLAQLSLYPLMEFVGASTYADYEKEHIRRISFLAWFIMGVEFASSIFLVLIQPDYLSPVFAWAGLVLIVLIWSNTWLVQEPYHRSLIKGYDKAIHSKLVSTNWIRVVAWSVRAVLLIMVLSRALLL